MKRLSSFKNLCGLLVCCFLPLTTQAGSASETLTVTSNHLLIEVSYQSYQYLAVEIIDSSDTVVGSWDVDSTGGVYPLFGWFPDYYHTYGGWGLAQFELSWIPSDTYEVRVTSSSSINWLDLSEF